MSNGIETTLTLLSRTRNEAAAAVLLPALDERDDTIRRGALRALLARRSPAGQQEIVRRWNDWSPEDVATIAEKPGSLSGAIRDGVLGTDDLLCQNGCAAAIAVGDYHCMPSLVTAIEARDDEMQDLAAGTLAELATRLYEQLAQTNSARDRRDPENARRHVVSTLEESIGRFVTHRRPEIIHAFLILVPRENSLLKRILRDPLHTCFRTVIQRLATDQADATYQLLLRFLEDPTAPVAALRVIAKRYDIEFLRQFFALVGEEPARAVGKNIQKMRSFGWTEQSCQRLLSLNDAEQHAAVRVIVESGMPREEKFTCLRVLIEKGTPGGRRAATNALAEFHGADANDLVLQSLKDEDPHVQANALGQLRERGVPGAMSTIIDAIDSDHDVVASTAKGCLSEFSIARYLAAFDTLNENAKQSTGALVAKVDESSAETLIEEMNAAARSRRIRAVEAATAMGLLGEVEPKLVTLLEDEDHILRAIVAGALAQCDSSLSRAALREALLDSSVAVQQTAQRSLEEHALGRAITPREIDVSALSLPETNHWQATRGVMQ